jgi:hypothetical protein
MGTSVMDQVRAFSNEYMQTRSGEPVRAREIAAWAIDHRRWAPGRSQLIDQCADLISRALREEYFRDKQGRRPRAKHSVRIKVGPRQESFWIDMRRTKRDLMELSLQQRRQQILGDCRQLQTDRESYNDNYNTGEPIQVPFNFEPDLAEEEALRKQKKGA